MVARFMHSEFFEFRPEFKVAMATNHLPEVRGTGPAIWDRLRVVPFPYRVPESERDQQLPARLRAEAAGILAWAARGCADWQRDGLRPPAAVTAATAEYRAEMDHVGRFIEECCRVDDGAWARAADLFELFCRWCAADGEAAMTQKVFGSILRAKGFRKTKGKAAPVKGLIVWWGLCPVDHGDHSTGFPTERT